VLVPAACVMIWLFVFACDELMMVFMSWDGAASGRVGGLDRWSMPYVLLGKFVFHVQFKKIKTKVWSSKTCEKFMRFGQC
jgi:hypothetical protein